MVPHCHSLAAPSAVILAGLVADQQQAEGPGSKGVPEYPLAGLVISGFGSSQNTIHVAEEHGGKPPPDQPPEYIDYPVHAKDSPHDTPGTPRSTSRAAGCITACRTSRLATTRRYRLVGSGGTDLCGRVKVPVMIGLLELDALWMGTEEHARDFAGGFAASGRVNASVVKGAPHSA